MGLLETKWATFLSQSKAQKLFLIKKIYPTGHVKKKKIGYFPTLGGEGGVSDKVGKFQLFFFEPFPNAINEKKSLTSPKQGFSCRRKIQVNVCATCSYTNRLN